MQIQDENGKNICSGISPKNRHIAEMFVASGQMLEILREVKADILNFDKLSEGTYNELFFCWQNLIRNKMTNNESEFLKELLLSIARHSESQKANAAPSCLEVAIPIKPISFSDSHNFAVVISMEPFVLMSEDAEIVWTQFNHDDFMFVCKEDTMFVKNVLEKIQRG